MIKRRSTFDGRTKAIPIPKQLLDQKSLAIQEVEMIMKKSQLFSFICYSQFVPKEDMYYVVVSHYSYEMLDIGQEIPLLCDDLLISKILPG